METRVHEDPRPWLFLGIASDRFLAHQGIKDRIGKHEGFVQNTEHLSEPRLKRQMPMAYPTRGSSEVNRLVHLKASGATIGPCPRTQSLTG